MADTVPDPHLYDERALDLLRGAAQEDDLTRTPAAAVAELGKTIAGIRRRFELADPTDPRGAAALALAEVIDPSSGIVDLKEVLARSTWSVVETLGAAGALPLLLEADRLFAAH
jgi:hypothetical protein